MKTLKIILSSIHYSMIIKNPLINNFLRHLIPQPNDSINDFLKIAHSALQQHSPRAFQCFSSSYS